MRFTAFIALTTIALTTALTACQSHEQALQKVTSEETLETPKVVWPSVQLPIQADAQMEARIQQLLSLMSTEQKVAQMIQADIGAVTPADIREFRIGSVLNGGGQTPRNKTNASARDWAQLADELFRASLAPSSGKVPIPLMWGTDAVHGHNNVHGATLYPHNIGLGATRNVDLVKRIAEATAREIAATGLDWNFAPTVAVARDDRWGRTYESFAEEPQLVAAMGAAVVEGLQGKAGSSVFLDHQHVLACSKHFIGDGGTQFGDDQGDTLSEEDELMRLHLPGYLSALEQGVQTVMVSFSSWNGVNSHANKRLITDLLKQHLGFDGIVVSDWQAIGNIPGCSIDNCAEAVNAGVDLFMIPHAPDWKNFYRNTLTQVWNGAIPMTRIDDAVSRILRVKLRAGLWEKPSPAQRVLAGQQTLIGHPEHRALARQAVRESLVLLKNNGVLPLNPKATLLVAGNAANNMSRQAGGWSVSWQGKDNPNSAYPGSTTVFAALDRATRAAGGRAILQEQGIVTTRVDAAIVVFGEEPYAEMKGDLENLATLEFEQHDKSSLAILKRLKAQGIPTVAVFFSGRPLWVNKELNSADAFVAAWLPGSEGAGVADVLLRNTQGTIAYDFSGKLSFSWPRTPCDTPLNLGDVEYSPLFPYGFGLSYQDPIQPWVDLPEDTRAWHYGCRLGDTLPPVQTLILNGEDGWAFYLEKTSLESRLVRPAGTSGFGSVAARMDFTNGYGISVRWDDAVAGRLMFRNQHKQFDWLPFYAQKGSLTFDIRVTKQPKKRVEALLYSGRLSGSHVDITPTLKKIRDDHWHTIRVDLNCFANERADFSKVDVPFGLQTSGAFAATVSNIRLEPETANIADIRCPQ